MVCAHTPQTERYTHYTPFKRPWIIESKVFFVCHITKRPPTKGGRLYKFYRFDSSVFYFLSEV